MPTAQRRLLGRAVDGQNIVLETNANGETKAKYLRGANLIAQAIGETLYYYLFNAHGDVVQRVASNGESCPKYVYDTFGNQRPQTRTNRPDADPNPFRYCGEYYDPETNEIYLRARYYSRETGRFGQEDPYWSSPEASKDYTSGHELEFRQAGNLYLYCLSNPISFRDEDGEIATFVAGAIAGAIFGAASVLISDLIAGEFSSWETYAGEALGGAVGGALALGTASLGIASVGQAVVANGSTQLFEMASGKRETFDGKGFICMTNSLV